MTYIARRFSHEKRVVHLDVGDHTLALDYKFKLNSGSAITQASIVAPPLTHTRASDADSFDSNGDFVAVGGNNLPRFAHDPANGNAQQGYLHEDAATNICLQSSDFTTTWVNINTDEPSTNNTDIFGTSTADEIAATSTADQQFAIHQSFTGLTANAKTSVAVHIKTGTNATFVQLVWDSDGGGTDGVFCNFQLTGSGTAGTVTALAAGTATQASISLTVQGFYRCIVTGNIITGTVGRFTINIVDRIDAAEFEAADLADNDSLIACGADVQVADLAGISSHIPTTTVSVTRAADVCSTTDVSWFNPTTGTFLVEALLPFHVTANSHYLMHAHETGQGTQGLQLQANSVGRGGFQLRNTSSQASTIILNSSSTTGWNLGAVNKYYIAYQENDSVGGWNATDVETETVNDPNMADVDIFHIGVFGAGGNIYTGFVQSIEFFNVRKPDSFLAAETG